MYQPIGVIEVYQNLSNVPLAPKGPLPDAMASTLGTDRYTLLLSSLTQIQFLRIAPTPHQSPWQAREMEGHRFAIPGWSPQSAYQIDLPFVR